MYSRIHKLIINVRYFYNLQIFNEKQIWSTSNTTTTVGPARWVSTQKWTRKLPKVQACTSNPKNPKFGLSGKYLLLTRVHNLQKYTRYWINYLLCQNLDTVGNATKMVELLLEVGPDWVSWEWNVMGAGKWIRAAFILIVSNRFLWVLGWLTIRSIDKVWYSGAKATIVRVIWK